jgi:hypothetical protein
MLEGKPLTIAGLGALLGKVTFFVAVTAYELLLVGTVLRHVALLTTIVTRTSTTTLWAIAREMANWRRRQ